MSIPVPMAALTRLPTLCEVCRRWADARLCGDCLARFAAPMPRCGRCGLRLGLAAATCGDCLREPPPFEHTLCAFDYGFPWDRLITAFKFHGQVELAAPLAARLAATVLAHTGPAVQCVLPVPLSPQRLAERGFNQAWELARRLATAARLPARADLLLRTLDTAHQAELGRAERQRNLRAAFFVDARLRTTLQQCRVALVDDVMTTGATVREASAALLRAGAAAVDVWVLARTPNPT